MLQRSCQRTSSLHHVVQVCGAVARAGPTQGVEQQRGEPAGR
jgi:hypothetical protein